jgi:hypothetical protein
MDRKTRYRQRLKLQAALRRVMEAYADNTLAGIPPDRTTALMAAQVIVNLLHYAREAGLTPEEATPLASDGPLDTSRFEKLIADKRRETNARRERKRRQVRQLSREMQQGGQETAAGMTSRGRETSGRL